jgi:hypothetical protein
MGFQGRSQLEKRYGQDAETMLSQPATKIFFKTSEPRAAKWISAPTTPAVDQLEVPKKPVKKQAAFAPFSKQRAVNEESSDWDELKWIE